MTQANVGLITLTLIVLIAIASFAWAYVARTREQVFMLQTEFDMFKTHHQRQMAGMSEEMRIRLEELFQRLTRETLRAEVTPEVSRSTIAAFMDLSEHWNKFFRELAELDQPKTARRPTGPRPSSGSSKTTSRCSLKSDPAFNIWFGDVSWGGPRRSFGVRTRVAWSPKT